MKKIKILTITLAIIALTMIAFFGVYTPVQNRMENQIKENKYDRNLKGSRNIGLKVNTQNTTIIKDENGNEVEDTENLTDEQIAQKGYTKEEKPNNSEEVKNEQNYKISKNIIEERLKKLGIENYNIKLDRQTGDMLIELPEDNRTDIVIANINVVGKFEIIDSQTKEVLMDNSSIKQAKVMYGSGGTTTSNSGTSVYLDIKFNKEGTKKLEEISSQYIQTQEDTNTTTNEITQEEEQNVTTEENTQEQQEENKKEITMKIDDQQIMSTSFEEPIKTGELQLSIGSSSTDPNTLHDYIDQASSMANVLDTGNLPVKYDLDENQYILTDITDRQIEIAIYVALAIIAVALLVILIKYKAIGALGIISFIGYLSLLTLVIRYTNVIISIEALVAIAIVLLLNYKLIGKLLEKRETKRAEIYQEFFIKMIPIILMTLIFCFIKWTPINSFGMTMFWGILLIAIYNYVITNSLLKISTGKEK